MDWKDMLSQIREDLPEGEAAADDIPVEVAKRKLPVIHIVVEKKGRGGKTATIAEGFDCTDDELAKLASDARRHLGCGGSARGGEILMQGDCRTRLADYLHSLGYKTK